MISAQRPIIPPAFIQARVSAAINKTLGSNFNLHEPHGEPALVGADSVSWRVFKNAVALLVGGIAAVILELAEPKVRAGVWDHTSFRKNPGNRLRRTGLAAMITVYGPRAEAEKMIANVRRMHERVRGTAENGEEYYANDPELLDWVQATAGFGFLQAYHRFVRPLTRADRDRYYGEGIGASALYGATSIQGTEASLQAYFLSMEPRLGPSPVIHEFLDIMEQAEILPAILRPVQRLLIRAGVELVPQDLREKLQIQNRGLRLGEETLVKFIGRLSDRIVLRESPAVQACERLGLPADYLYQPASRRA